MKLKEESEKPGLKLSIAKNKDHGTQSHHFIANRWGNNGKSDSLYFPGLQKWLHVKFKCLLLGSKTMTNLNSILKSRDITLLTKVCIIKAMIFPVLMYGYESWIIKKAERWRIDAFELWCWRKLLGVPWTARRSNQPILKEINPEYLLKELILKSNPVLWPSDAKNWLIGRDPDAGKDWKQEKKGASRGYGWMASPALSLSTTLGNGEGQGSLACFIPWGYRVRHDLVTEQ